MAGQVISFHFHWTYNPSTPTGVYSLVARYVAPWGYDAVLGTGMADGLWTPQFTAICTVDESLNHTFSAQFSCIKVGETTTTYPLLTIPTVGEWPYATTYLAVNEAGYPNQARCTLGATTQRTNQGEEFTGWDRRDGFWRIVVEGWSVADYEYDDENATPLRWGGALSPSLCTQPEYGQMAMTWCNLPAVSFPNPDSQARDRVSEDPSVRFSRLDQIGGAWSAAAVVAGGGGPFYQGYWEPSLKWDEQNAMHLAYRFGPAKVGNYSGTIRRLRNPGDGAMTWETVEA